MFKSKALEKDPEKDKDAAADAAEVVGRTVQQQQSVVEQPPPRREPMANAATRSCIGSDMSIVGNIECNGPAQVFGRIKGELRASDLLIGDGAQIDGTVIAQNVTVCGCVKGTIRAVRVKLQNSGAVEGDIFHRSLSIDENSQFGRVSNLPACCALGPPACAAPCSCHHEACSARSAWLPLGRACLSAWIEHRSGEQRSP